jgi:hypothetical protein
MSDDFEKAPEIMTREEAREFWRSILVTNPKYIARKIDENDPFGRTHGPELLALRDDGVYERVAEFRFDRQELAGRVAALLNKEEKA